MSDSNYLSFKFNIKDSDIEPIKRLLEQFPYLLSSQDCPLMNTRNMLEFATYIGNYPAIISFLRIGVKPTIFSIRNAISCGYYQCAAILVEKRDMIDVVFDCGSTPLHLAAKSVVPKESCFCSSYPCMCDRKPYQDECIMLRLFEGINPNIQDRSGNTALMYAASLGRRKMIQYLVALGTNPYLTNKEGKTAADLQINIPNDVIY